MGRGGDRTALRRRSDLAHGVVRVEAMITQWVLDVPTLFISHVVTVLHRHSMSVTTIVLYLIRY